jgi:tetratricopeptide (TPR) repeat protein
MRVSMLVVVLATLTAIPDPVRADDYGDLDQCRFVGQIGRADRSIAACDRVLGDAKLAAPSRVAALSSRCGWWWTKKDPDRALPDCDEAIRIDRGYVPAYVNRGNAYLNKGDSERAFADFNEAIRLDPNSAWAYNARGDLYKSRGELDHAMADFNEAIRLDPNYAMAYFFRSNLHKMAGDFEHALADLNQSIRLDPGDAMAYFTRGSVSYLMGDTPGALADFATAIRFAPNDAAAYFNRGVAYYMLGGHIADAEADLRKATELDPRDAYAALWRDLAERRNNMPSHLPEIAKQLDRTAWPAPVISEFLGESNLAQTLAAAHDNDPKASRARTCEANFYSGEFALLKKNRQEALRLLRLAASDCPRGFIEAPAAMEELIVQR